MTGSFFARTFVPKTLVMGLCKRKGWVVRPGTREFRVGWNGYINSKIGSRLCGRGGKSVLDLWEAHISWTCFGQGEDSVVRFCLDSVFGVNETSNWAELVTDDSKGVRNVVMEGFLVIFAAKEVISKLVHKLVTTDVA